MVASEISKLAVSNESEVIQINTGKIPFRDIRKEALRRNKSFLKIKDGNYYTQLNREEIISELQKIHEKSVMMSRKRDPLWKKIPAPKTLAPLAWPLHTRSHTCQLWSHAFFHSIRENIHLISGTGSSHRIWKLRAWERIIAIQYGGRGWKRSAVVFSFNLRQNGIFLSNWCGRSKCRGTCWSYPSEYQDA